MSEKKKARKVMVCGDCKDVAELDEAKLREAIGAGPDEQLEFVTPQFERPEGQPAPAPCPDRATFDRMSDMSPGELLKLGMRPWNDPSEEDDEFNGRVLWLLPGEWYDQLPEGYPFVGLCNEPSPFQRGVSDNDIRFGCLPYGVLGPGRLH
jgi:hypothetical protein